ncbi:Hypothetical predicted protein [Olea europaea subsp. europaea]|uniref:Uncharacterized protein n=1 Tax=Olea europaea subsp. europaea TaxID=158383 RepID=A0A8S0QE33_OLEEU|nr:Hypothetical predicted protein [Olea europaea subsp. europaea]
MDGMEELEGDKGREDIRVGEDGMEEPEGNKGGEDGGVKESVQSNDVDVVDQESVDIVEAGVHMRSDEQAAKIVVEDAAKDDDRVDANDGLLEHFTNPKYEQSEEEYGDNDDDDRFFELSEGFNIGVGKIGNVQDNEERDGRDAKTD